MTEEAGMFQWINQFMNSRLGAQVEEDSSPPPPAPYPVFTEEVFNRFIEPQYTIPRTYLTREQLEESQYEVRPGQIFPLRRPRIEWNEWYEGERRYFNHEYPTTAEDTVVREEESVNTFFEYNQDLVDKAIQHLRGLEDFSNAVNPEVVSRDILGPDFQYNPPRTWVSREITPSPTPGIIRDRWSEKITYMMENGIADQWDIGRTIRPIHEFLEGKTEKGLVQIARHPVSNEDMGLPSLDDGDVVITIYSPLNNEYHDNGRTVKLDDVDYSLAFRTYNEDQFAQINELSATYEDLGYDIIKAKVSRRLDQPIAAIKDKNIVVFFTSTPRDTQFHRLLTNLVERVVEENHGSEIWEQTNGTVRSILSSYQGLDDVLSGRRQSLTAARRTVVEHRDGLAASIRRELDLLEEIRHMENNRLDMAIDRFRSLGALGTIISNIRPIKSHRITFRNGSPIIEFITYPYVMEYDGSRMEIPELRTVIDTNDSYIESAIRIHCADDSYPWYHPHVYHGECCFGHASGALAESFARRDWESMIRVLVTYITQYNNASPHIQFFDLAEDYLGYTDRNRGWVYPEEPTPVISEPSEGSSNATEESNDGSEPARDDSTEDNGVTNDGEQVLSEGPVSV